MVVGAHVKLIPSGPQRIEYYGWQQWPELLSLLSRCDFLYLPQPFYEGARQVAEFSFPNKICTYVPVGKPILLHGPEYGSLVSFFERFPCGPVCSKLPAAELLAQVERAVNDPSLYQSYVTNAMRAYEEELNAQTLESNVRMFLSSFGSAT
jgi:glycosyltransferase involved in cell wall biosynthesis